MEPTGYGKFHKWDTEKKNCLAGPKCDVIRFEGGMWNIGFDIEGGAWDRIYKSKTRLNRPWFTRSLFFSDDRVSPKIKSETCILSFKTHIGWTSYTTQLTDQCKHVIFYNVFC